MYISSINSFVACCLLLYMINPLCSRAERSYRVPYFINSPVHYESQPIQPVPIEKQLLRNIYYRNYYNSEQPKVFPKDVYSEVNVKQNAAKSMLESEVGKLYKPYNYPKSRYAGNQEILKKENPTYFSQMEQRYEEARSRDEEITKKLNVLDKLLSENSDENDIDSKNTIEDRNFAQETSIPEETKRVVRQVRKQRPGFFWTLARIAFETVNDTRSAIQQISDIISQSFEPDMPTTQRPVSKNPLTVVNATTGVPSNDQNNMSSNLENMNVTTMRTTTTTKAYKFTRNSFQNLLRRNFRGLVRLFNIEWQDALNQSEITVREFQKDLGKQIGSFLRDNPNAY